MLYMRVRTTNGVILVPLGVVFNIRVVTCGKMGNRWGRHQVGFSIHLIGSRH